MTDDTALRAGGGGISGALAHAGALVRGALARAARAILGEAW